MARPVRARNPLVEQHSTRPTPVDVVTRIRPTRTRLALSDLPWQRSVCSRSSVPPDQSEFSDPCPNQIREGPISCLQSYFWRSLLSFASLCGFSLMCRGLLSAKIALQSGASTAVEQEGRRLRTRRLLAPAGLFADRPLRNTVVLRLRPGRSRRPRGCSGRSPPLRPGYLVRDSGLKCGSARVASLRFLPQAQPPSPR
jgi:hypothetical protein